MSKISKEEVLKLSQLSNIAIDDLTAENMQKELEELINFFNKLDEVDTSELDPTYQVSGNINVMREDQRIDYNVSSQQLVNLSDEQQDGSLKVPRVL